MRIYEDQGTYSWRDEIIFDDTQAGEQLGEFPSMWDLIGGNVEISKLGRENTIALFKGASITSLMKTPKNYLPGSFTIEQGVYIGLYRQESSDTYSMVITASTSSPTTARMKDVPRTAAWSL